MPAPDWPIRTERLVLRPFGPEDFDALLAIHSDERVVRWLYNDARNAEEVATLLERKIRGASVSDEGEWLSAAATDSRSGTLVADVVLLWESREHHAGEIGFIVHPDEQGNGYATEAARALLPFAFDTLGIHRLIGRTEARNVGSARVLEKLKMRREAHFVENEWVKGEWQSEVVYALLDREWRPAQRPVPTRRSSPPRAARAPVSAPARRRSPSGCRRLRSPGDTGARSGSGSGS